MPLARELRFARRCYGHLAGALGVAVTEAMVARGMLRIASATAYDLTRAGHDWLDGFGLDPHQLTPSKAGLARRCLDGSERRHHLGGPLGVSLLERMMALGWLERPAPGRALRLTPVGTQELANTFGLSLDGPAQDHWPAHEGTQ